MSAPTGHGDWDALAVGWALSALDPADEERFAAHLPTCDRCTATVRESLYTVADLAYALPDEVPPPSLKNRIMAAVAAEPRSPTERLAAGAASADGSRPAAGPGLGPVAPAAGPADPGVVVPLASRRRRRVTAAAAAAAVALLAALTTWNVRLQDDRGELRAALDQQSTVAAQREAVIRELTANEPARVAALAATRPDRPRPATIVIRGDRVEIIVEALRPTDADLRYWLWTLDCSDPARPRDLRAVEGFRIAQPQFSVRSIGSDPGFATATCFALSSERGTATPTTPTEVVAIGRPAT